MIIFRTFGRGAKYALGGCKICTGGGAISARGGGAKSAPNNNIYIIKYIIIEYNKGAEALWVGRKRLRNEGKSY